MGTGTSKTQSQSPFLPNTIKLCREGPESPAFFAASSLLRPIQAYFDTAATRSTENSGLNRKAER